MSHITHANQGLAAVDAKNWDVAIGKLSRALQTSTNPAWLLARSKALINVKRYEEALDDANLAFHTAYERNKRDSMIDAHYRRAVAYYRLGQYANADCCAIYAMRLAKGHAALDKEDVRAANSDEDGFWKPTADDAMAEAREDPFNQTRPEGAMSAAQPAHVGDWRRASTLRIQALTAMKKLPADDEARKATAPLRPVRKELSTFNRSNDETAESSKKTEVTAQKPVIPADAPLRLQDFQTNTVMSVTIFSKGVNKEKLKVDFLPESVRLKPLVYPNGDEKEFLLQTFAEIDPSTSGYAVTPNKVELRLVKKEPGKWSRVTRDAPEIKNIGEKDTESQAIKEARQQAMDEADEKAKDEKAAAAAVQAGAANKAEDTAGATGPAYPSSSRTGPKNWDKIGADEDEEEEAGVNDFFKKLYKGATPEQQRAMMKSFIESNGTSLSTDWDDVGSRTVETVPPEGVEPKKW
ncbi:SGT1 and CS domain containing protein [Metarhizium album ARSEF 1941]|uniref:SGT1 and CS domain containing protein n=1 Tax=Metarhizium album (strain ARSEF 1941) TaxID=1081103 RepID=A0A0B2WNB6_METAS|nr:SGT1 and CS domain containing protein [Metarhizium album ARSEF 1941]KHN94982.1 SGT1 and CS domain containing protein [Metarhizium album ARSEF 1941]